jgi:hypothetical protein
VVLPLSHNVSSENSANRSYRCLPRNGFESAVLRDGVLGSHRLRSHWNPTVFEVSQERPATFHRYLVYAVLSRPLECLRPP